MIRYFNSIEIKIEKEKGLTRILKNINLRKTINRFKDLSESCSDGVIFEQEDSFVIYLPDRETIKVNDYNILKILFENVTITKIPDGIIEK